MFFETLQLLPWQWAVWIALGLAIGLAKVGFVGLIAAIVPVTAVIFGAKESTGLVLPLLCFADILASAYYRRHVQWKYILRLLPWTLAGFALAVFVVHLVPVQVFRFLMGGGILAGLVVMVWNDRRGKDNPPPSSWWFSAIFGIAGGFVTVVGNAAGPILAVFLLSMRLPKNNFVATTAWYFFILNLLKLPIHIFMWGTITTDTLLFNIPLIPVIITGVILGVFLIKKIPETVYRKLVMILTLVATILLFI